MHHSRLSALIIDCRTDSLDEASRFWAGALGRDAQPPRSPDDVYVVLAGQPEAMKVELQKVAHDSRVHLDIETDDIEAEVRRLEQLGARRVGRVKHWWVLEAPTGHRFCVVPATGALAGNSNRWD